MTPAKQPRAALYARQSRNKAKSIDDQLAECRADAEASGYHVVVEYTDGRSASRYTIRRRESWPLVLAAVARRDFDVIVLWEASRGDRTLTTWSAFLDLCREHEVTLRVVNDEREYDLAIDSDWRTLADAGVDAAHESGKLSKRIRRGVASAAKDGRPSAGPCPYGYRRVFDAATGKLAGQEVDPQTAPIVREIIARAGKGEPISVITRDLNARGVTPPGGGATWYRQRVRELAMSPVYAGKRVHRPGRGTQREKPRVVHVASWPALVTEAEHQAARRVLDDPTRKVKNQRPGRQIHLLTYLATCERCAGPITARLSDYVCPAGHVSIRREPVDKHVEGLLFAYLARKDVYATLRAHGEGADVEVMAARDEAAALRGRLEEWRASAAAGRTTDESLAVIEATLTRDIRSAEQRAERASIPPALRSVLAPGADVRVRYRAAPLAARRTVIVTLLSVTLRPSGRNAYRPIEERVTVRPRAVST